MCARELPLWSSDDGRSSDHTVDDGEECTLQLDRETDRYTERERIERDTERGRGGREARYCVFQLYTRFDKV